jgi:zinc D-Ala-D-Ala dipeptidase
MKNGFGKNVRIKGKCLLTLSCLVVILTSQLPFPVDCRSEGKMPAGFVDVQKVIPSLQVDIRYAGEHNFIGERITGYNAPKCILTKQAAAALARVQKELETFSLSLKVYDGYRPQRAVDHFVRWAKDLGDTRTKKEFYPTLEKRDLFKDDYIATKSGHSRGSTVDLTIVILPVSGQAPWRPGEKLEACYSPVEVRYRDNGLDMGTGFDCFHELSHTVNNKIGREQRMNRLLLKTIMEKHGFANYEKEWWHFTLKNEPFPKTYFDFVIE